MKKKFIALLVSAAMLITSVSPAFASEFSGAEDVSVFVQEQPTDMAGEQSDASGTEEADGTFFESDSQEPDGPLTEQKDSAEPAEDPGTEDSTGASDQHGEDSFTDVQGTLSNAEEASEEVFSDADTESLFGNSDGTELVCTIAPIRRENEFTPFGNGVDTPSLEEAVAEAGPELYTAGSEANSVNQADVNAMAAAVDTLRAAMVNRKGSVNLSVKLTFEVPQENWNELVYTILLLAFEETGNPCEGDYLRWHFDGTGEGTITYDSSVKTYCIYLPFSFYTTYAQEQKVTSAVNSAISGMKITDSTTPYMKIRKVYDYVCRTVTYDEAHENDNSYTPQFTAYGAIINKTAVCQGYTLLMYRMLMELGVINRMVPSEEHIWNLVYLRGCFYNLDATWDAGVNPSQYEFFLKGRQSFEAYTDHIREVNELFGDYDSDEFNNMYPTSQTDYEVQSGDTKECTHTWDAWKEAVAATCTTEGIRFRVCSNCGKEEDEIIAKTAHKWGSYSSKGNNTHTLKCSVCGTSKTQSCTFKNYLCTKCKGQQVPGRVKISKVSSAGYNKLKISWSAVEGATAYGVFYLKDGRWKYVGKATGTSYTHTGTAACPVKTGAACYFRVRAYNTVNGKNSFGAYSVKAGGKAVADKPVLVSAAAKAYNKVTITWNKAAGATAYLIYRKNGTKWERVAVVKDANATSYTHTSSAKFPIVPGTEYTYTVRSYTKTGNTYGLYDKTGKTVTTTLGRASITVSRVNTGLKITWKKVYGAAGYQIQRYYNGKWSTRTVSADTLSYTDTTAKTGINYAYRVRAYGVYNNNRVYGKFSVVKKMTR